MTARDLQPLLDDTGYLVPLLLGALKLLDDFVMAIDERAKSPAADADPADEPLLAAGLGLISLHRTARRWADLASSGACGRRGPATPGPARSPSLLR